MPCEGAQYVGPDNGWVWIEYHDDAVTNFQWGDKVEFEWIVPIEDYNNTVSIGLCNFSNPDNDDADGEDDPSGNEYGVVEKDPEDWVKGNTYYAFFNFYDDPLPEGNNITLEIEFNEFIPVCGCQVKDVPQYEGIYWINADRTGCGYEHDYWPKGGASSSMATPIEPEVKDYSDFITVDLLSLEEMRTFQEKNDLNITGVELFNAETGETAWVYLTQGESVEQGVQRLEEWVVKDLSGFEMVKAKDLSGFRVYAIRLSQTPSAVLEDSMVLNMGKVHPNDAEWEGNP